MTITQEEAATAVGMKPREVVAWEQTADGLLVTTHDGVVSIVVPEDRPDGEGKTGLMLFVKPNPEALYSCPVFAPHEAPAADADGDEGAAPKPKGRGRGPKADAPAAGDEGDQGDADA